MDVDLKLFGNLFSTMHEHATNSHNVYSQVLDGKTWYAVCRALLKKNKQGNSSDIALSTWLLKERMLKSFYAVCGGGSVEKVMNTTIGKEETSFNTDYHITVQVHYQTAREYGIDIDVYFKDRLVYNVYYSTHRGVTLTEMATGDGFAVVLVEFIRGGLFSTGLMEFTVTSRRSYKETSVYRMNYKGTTRDGFPSKLVSYSIWTTVIDWNTLDKNYHSYAYDSDTGEFTLTSSMWIYRDSSDEIRTFGNIRDLLVLVRGFCSKEVISNALLNWDMR